MLASEHVKNVLAFIEEHGDMQMAARDQFRQTVGYVSAETFASVQTVSKADCEMSCSTFTEGEKLLVMDLSYNYCWDLPSTTPVTDTVDIWGPYGHTTVQLATKVAIEELWDTIFKTGAEDASK